MQLNSVVFPAPFGPISPVTELLGTVTDTSFKAVTPPKFLVTPVQVNWPTPGCDLATTDSSLGMRRAALPEVLEGATESLMSSDAPKSQGFVY